VIDNQGFYDANVYFLIAHDGMPQRLGIVTGNSTHRYALTGPNIRPGYTIILYAKTVGEGQEYRSDELTIFAGTGMRWTLLPKGHDIMVPLPSKAATE
jgi:hypothetical protein